MVSKTLVALALVLSGVEGFPPNQEVLLSVGSVSRIEGYGIEDVLDELKKAEIIPTVIDDFLPVLSLDVQWSKKRHTSLGNTLKPKKLQDTPSVILEGPESSAGVCGSETQLVITLTDPDAPSRDDPKWSEMCHWIAAGLSASPKLGPRTGGCPAMILSGLDVIMPYKPPGPPEKTGKHRYVFLVFAPANGTTDELHLSKPSDRQHWGYDGPGHGVRDWAQDNGLVPIAANFIYAQNEKQ